MAIIYVSAVDGNNADSGADWANAKQTVAGALAIFVSGDIIFVDNAGTFNAGANITWTPGAGYVAIISVNRSGGDAWAAGAAENASGNFVFALANVSGASGFVYGMTIGSGSNANNGATRVDLFVTTSINSGSWEFDTCTFLSNTTNTGGTTGRINIGSSGTNSRDIVNTYRNCTFSMPNSTATGGIIKLGQGIINFYNPTITFAGASKPTVLFAPASLLAACRVTIVGDLSGFNTTSGFYFDVGAFASGTILLKGVKLSSTPSLVTGTWPANGSSITLRQVDSGDTINAFEYRNRLGTLTEDTATYAGSGASFNGSSVSWLVVTTSSCDEANPFVLPALSIWNTVTSAQTATVEILRDSVTDLTDREVWLELAYPSSASFPTYTVATDRNANPFSGTAVDQPNSAVVWTESLTNDNEQYVSVSFTAAEVGLLEGRVVIAKASTTFYVDPKLRVA